MENESIIKVTGLSKRYRIGLKEELHDSLASSITSFLKSPFKSFKNLRRLANTSDESEDVFYALKDINFEVKKGEVLGIVGMNGAGKSTLLKVLSRITEPTFGEIEIKGRVASLLEVGTGFHPDLTGRENIFLNGTLLGMSKKEIISKMEEIIEFSGVRKFIDTPVKRYSSGMRVRLAFSVAAHLDPEILIIDEVLAVGDYEFQNKCMGKMQDAASNGKTVLFVSHNLAAVKQLCTRAILLKNGEKIAEGSVDDIIDKYKSVNKLGIETVGKKIFSPSDDVDFELLELGLYNSEGKNSYNFEYIEEIKIEVIFKILKSKPNYYIYLSVVDQSESTIFVTSDEDLIDGYLCGTLKPSNHKYNLWIPSKILKPGRYAITINCCNMFYPNVKQYPSVIHFEIIDSKTSRGIKSLYRPDQIVAPEIKWEFQGK